MTKVYTDRWNGFQFQAPVYLDGHHNPYQFSLVKWKTCEPFEALIWDPKEEAFDFESCGLRYLEHRIDGLEKFIINFALMIEEEFLDEKCE